MSGISISAGLINAEARRALRDLLEKLDKPRSAYGSIGETLVGSTQERFRTERGPDDVPWLNLKPATIRARLKRRASQIRILSEYGYLSGSISADASNEGVRVGSVAKQAAIHQLGGMIEKTEGKRWMVGRRFAKRKKGSEGKEVSIRAHKIIIPSRPFLGASREDEERIATDLQGWLLR